MSLDYEAISVNDRCKRPGGFTRPLNLTRRRKQTGRKARPAETYITTIPYLANGRRCSCRAACVAREGSFRIAVACITGLVNLDRALKVSAVLDHDSRGGEIADHRAILLDLDAVARSQIPFYVAIDDH